MSENQAITLYLVRHGQTEWNAREILQGQKDASLTPLGVEQAKKLSLIFKEKKIDAIYSSDLGRAISTATIISDHHNLAIQQNALIRERTFGIYEGWRAENVQAELVQKLHHAKNLPTQERMEYHLAPDIETDSQLVQRFIQFISHLKKHHAGQTILAVSHGGMIRAVLLHLKFGTHDELPRKSVDNLGYLVLEITPDNLKLKETHGVTKQTDTSTDRL